MAAVYDTEQALATFRCGGQDPNLFLLVSWRGTEAVSSLYKFDVDLASADDNIDLENLLGRRATLAVTNQKGDVMPWHGIITAIRQTRRDETYAYYSATLEPQLALLRMFRQSRIYMHASQQSGGDPNLADIIRMVLEQIGLSQEGEPSPNFTPDYAIRIPSADLSATKSNFVCQFEETSLDFLQRRLEHEGVYFWFEQGPDREVVVFGNQIAQQPADAIDVFWRDSGSISHETDKISVNSFNHNMRVQPKSVVLREFSVKQPSLDLTINTDIDPHAEAPVDRFDGLGSIEVYGSHYSKQDQGSRIAKIRAEELASLRNSYDGESPTPGIRAGYSINLQEYFRDDVNGKYYVIAVNHEGNQSLPRQTTVNDASKRYYHAAFKLIPADVQFRPARTTKKPRVIGFISAIIEAEGDGEYAEMNEYGCYRIRFLFAPPGSGQQGSANSAWVRMATPYAGSQHGMNLPLLKGTEVLVSFLGGDPDRPVIVSAIPNEENPSLRNQNNATQPGLQTAGQNMLNFEDKKDSESATLSTPNAQSTLHLGNDPDDPMATGVRMATTGHYGQTSSSSIRDIPSIYSEKIGADGNVGLDAAQQQAIKAAMAKNKTDNLMQQAMLPNAEPAVQMMALQAQQALAGMNLSAIQESLAKAQNAKPVNNKLIESLQAGLAQAQEKADSMTELVSAVSSGNKSADQALGSLGKEKSESEKSDDQKDKTKDDKKDEKKPNPNTQLTNGTKNEMTYGASNSITMGVHSAFDLSASLAVTAGILNSITLGMNNAVTVASSNSLTEGAAKDFKVFGCKELGTTYFRTSVREEEETAKKFLISAEYKMVIGDLFTNAVNYDLVTKAHTHNSLSHKFSGINYLCDTQNTVINSQNVAVSGKMQAILKSEAMLGFQVGSVKIALTPAFGSFNAPLLRLC